MNPIKAWLLAIRPKTLAGALAPIGVALTMAWVNGYFLWKPALLCAVFALLMQIDANLINDYFDYRNGTDGEERLGPERACARGWISPHAMLVGIILCTLSACLVGLPLVHWGGWEMILLGLICVLACFLYTTTFSRVALGDLLVLLFFGIIPVCVTYYLQVGEISRQVLMASVAMGLVTDCLLLVNNYRDRDTDYWAGKRTLVVIIGGRATLWLYFWLGPLAIALVFPTTILPLLYLPLHLHNWQSMFRIHKGRELNTVLGRTSLAILLFAILYCAGVVLEM